MADTKVCLACGIEKDVSEFYFIKAKNRPNPRCIPCYKEYRKPLIKSYAEKNRDDINKRARERVTPEERAKRNQYAKEYHQKNREAGLESRRSWYKSQDREQELEKRREWYRQNKEKHAAARTQYELNNKDRLRAARRKWENKRLDTDVNYRLHKALAWRVRAVTRGVYKRSKTTEKLIGCSVEFFRSYMESQFLEGMTWDNWASDGWHIDHKIPLSWFNLENENCRSIAFHYTNMQPLWQQDNNKKKNFYHHALYSLNDLVWEKQ